MAETLATLKAREILDSRGNPTVEVEIATSGGYRGLASVIVGGMLVSTLFTLILLPSLLRMRETIVVPDSQATATQAG